MRPWYCAQTAPRQLERAKKELMQQGFAVFDPVYLETDAHRHVRVKHLFTNYLFVSFDDTALWPRIKNTIGVSRILTYQPEDSEYRIPSSVGSNAIEALRKQSLALEANSKRRAETMITAGCYVRVISGIFKDWPGLDRAIVQWSEGDRATLVVDIFNRRSNVEFYHRDLVLT